MHAPLQPADPVFSRLPLDITLARDVEKNISC
jgi:hypothetical protein